NAAWSERSGKLNLQMTEAPLAVTDALSRRFDVDFAADGKVTLNGHLDWSPASTRATIEKLVIADLDVTAPVLRGDRLRADEIAMQGVSSYANGRFEIADWMVTSEWGEATGSGSVAVADLQPSTWWRAAEGEAKVAVDFARLSRMLPRTLRMREGVVLDRGVLRAQATAVRGDAYSWRMSAGTSSISATLPSGRRVAWSPVQADVDVVRDARGWRVSNATCKSDYFELQARGDATLTTVTARGNLDRFAKDVNQVADLGEVEVGGELQFTGHFRPSPDNGWAAAGDLHLSQFVVALPKWRPIREPQLKLDYNVSTSSGESGGLQLNSATVNLNAGGDQLSVTMDEPAQNREQSDLHLRLSGELSSWLARAQAVLPNHAWRGSGAVDVELTCAVTGQSIAVQEADLQLEQAVIHGPGLTIDEPRILLALRGVWDGQQRHWRGDNLSLQTSAAALGSRDYQVALADAPTAIGLFQVRGDWERLTRWLDQPPAARVAGGFTGTVALEQQGDAVAVEWSTDHEDLVVFSKQADGGATRQATGPRATPLWEEPHVSVKGRGQWRPAEGSWRWEQLEVSTNWLQVSATGQVASTPAATVDVRGQLVCDWRLASRRLEPLFRSPVQFEGQGAWPFQLKYAAADGSRADGAAAIDCQAEFGWERAQFQGLEFGAAHVSARYDGGRAAIQPLDVAVGKDGKLHLEPTLWTKASGNVLQIGERSSLQRVHMTPEMCTHWLKYVAPPLADATRVEGQLTVELAEDLLAPLHDWGGSQGKGVLTIHRARVGPSAITAPVLQACQVMLSIADPATASRLKLSRDTWLDLPTQDVPFDVRDRRVYHQGVVVRLGEVELRSRGSVGLDDESLDLVIGVPVRDRWIKNLPVLAGIAGKQVELRVNGTFRDPGVDERVFRDLLKKSGTEAAREAAGRFLFDQLDKLIKPPRN
ncbi:MAG: hypothetical protein CML07_08210, partial [Psychrobacter sp.]|nr:hypothetical protein [Psychrobacter sp.]